MTLKLPITVESDSAKTTEKYGAALAELLLSDSSLPRFVALDGELGAGKTAFTRGFCSLLTPGAAVRSPTFSLVNEYRGKLPVFHFDVYRINDEDDLYSTGFYDYAARGGFIICEWAVNIPYAMPERFIFVKINKTGENSRRIEILEKNENTIY